MTKGRQANWSDNFKLDLEPVSEDTTTPGGDAPEIVDEAVVEEIDETVVTDEPETTNTEATTTKVEESPEGVFAPFMGFIKEGVLTYDEEKEYDNSTEGIKELIQDNIKAQVEAWKNQYPKEALDVLEHLKNGGSLNELMEVEQEFPNYEKDVDLTNELHQRYLVEDFLAEQGYDDQEIAAKLDRYEEAGMLEEEAKTAHKKLIAITNKKKEQIIQSQAAKIEQRNQEIKTRTENFRKKVTETKEIAGFQLKAGEQQKLLDYMTKPVQEGKTQMQLDYDEDAQLKMAYFLMKKFDFKKVEEQASTKASIKLKNLVSRANDSNLSTKGTVVPKEQGQDKYSNEVTGLPWQTGPKIRK